MKYQSNCAAPFRGLRSSFHLAALRSYRLLQTPTGSAAVSATKLQPVVCRKALRERTGFLQELLALLP